MFALMLATTAQYSPPPPAPPGAGAPCSPSSGCSHSCGAYSFNLGAFKSAMAQQANPSYYNIKDSQDHDYYFDPCGPITAAVCDGSSVQAGQVAAIQTWIPGTSPFSSDSCAAIGSFSSGSCTASSADSLSCKYTGGDGSRQVVFQYNAGTLSTPTAEQTSYSPDTIYTITLTGPIAGGPDAAAGGLSMGSLFLILFLGVACPLYFGGGYYYNYKYKEMRGMEAVPQIEYWRQLPGLVKDGCKFSYKETNAFVEKMMSKDGATADPALKQALADDEGGSSTAYQENKA